MYYLEVFLYRMALIIWRHSRNLFQRNFETPPTVHLFAIQHLKEACHTCITASSIRRTIVQQKEHISTKHFSKNAQGCRDMYIQECQF